jgi:hypothetical protein
MILSQAKPGRSIGEELRITGSCYDRVLRPFLQGVFLTDPDNVDAVYGRSIIRSFVNGQPGIPQEGVGELPKFLARRIRNIVYNARVDHIVQKSVQTNLGTWEQ